MKYLFLFLILLPACSSSPSKYEKLRTVDDVLENYDTVNNPNGMAITHKGAVVDIHFEEVQAEKKHLETQLALAQEKIERLNDSISWLERDNVQMRIRLGLSAEKPKTTGKCCGQDGYLVPGSLAVAPTLDQEIKSKEDQ